MNKIFKYGIVEDVVNVAKNLAEKHETTKAKAKPTKENTTDTAANILGTAVAIVSIIASLKKEK